LHLKGRYTIRQGIPRKENERHMQELKYLAGYPDSVTNQVSQLVTENRLGSLLVQKYPSAHAIRTEKALYDYTVAIKNEYLRTSQPISKVIYDGKINVIHHALGTHTFVSRVQGVKLKAKHEIRIASVFKDAPLEFLKMIVVHELAHLKEKEHNRAFYKLCEYMEPNYHKLEFDVRLFLTQMDISRPLYR
jgi:predicted metal-dependent hydrolase